MQPSFAFVCARVALFFCHMSSKFLNTNCMAMKQLRICKKRKLHVYNTSMTDPISFQQWQAADIRLGTVVEALEPEWSEKLIELHVDFGAEIGQRTIFTGLRPHKSAADFQGKQTLFLINLPPRKMGPSQSQGMLLAFDPPAEGGPAPENVLLMLFDQLGPNGSRLL